MFSVLPQFCIASVLYLAKRYNVFVLEEYLCANCSESKVAIKYSGAFPSITFFLRTSLLSLNS